MGEQAYELKHEKKRKVTKKKVILLTIGALVIILVGLFVFVSVFINRSMPQLEGQIKLPILKEEVTVITDSNGVPHIKAANNHDLFIAQGYMQAQNRMFQMEMSRRQASGTLSEIVGEKAINTDKYFRTLGLRRAAEKSYALYSEESKEVLQYFADGVNAYIHDAIEGNSLPIEFTLMGAKPADWTPLDSLTIGKYMAFDLGGHWERQAFNYYLLGEFDDEKAMELFPHYPEEKPTIIKYGEVDIASSFENAIIPNTFNGSNNWVVSGKKTASGLPLLADDPHLGLATPSIWLQMHLETEDLNVSGVIFAGVPGIILGHNDHIAWGVTNVGPDVQQLYLEKRNPEHPDEFLFEGKWEKAEIIDEPIEVADKAAVNFQVTETRHGPVVSEFAEDSGKDAVLSLRWTALDPTTELEAILEINKAENWNQFEKGLEKFLAPAQNFVFASNDGTIAYKANGNIPIYESGDDALLPLPGWEKGKEWKGFIPFDELPTVINPDKGYIATANNKIVGDDYPYHISNMWAQPYRYERIAEVLETNKPLTAKDMKDLQMDATNLQAREFLPVFSEVLKDSNLTKEEEQAMAVLRDWNYIDAKELSQPLIFHRWIEEIEKQIYEKDIPDTMMEMFGAKGQTTDELLRKAYNGDGSIWIEQAGGLKEVLHVSLKNALTDLKDKFGNDITKWTWGDFHKVQFNHPLSGIHPVLSYFFNNTDSMPVDGSSVTPMAAAYDAEDGEVDHGASWRFVIDTNDMQTGHHIVGPGQFGHFKSKWYDDQMDDWVDGNYHETALNETEGLELKLVP
ncbi:penicillin acylase family protein [Virgibacillus halodenitrificans]|uniref:penicillin acylase family protein n=1 Tax=Virgibacillus halodenitrificans TaxID=1482 RepID=UPI00045CC946|nr:penicillin acylase family protein [Virgibacillus halodenitrificans]CDQ30931.1 Penicillin acylase 2 precursor [Virgibacillus halodenitrificans]